MAFEKRETKKFKDEVTKIVQSVSKKLDPTFFHSGPKITEVDEWRFSNPNYCVLAEFNPEVFALIAYFGVGEDVNYSFWNNESTSELDRLSTGINVPIETLYQNLLEDLEEMEKAFEERSLSED